ncbi:hypothetical protein N7532_002911 [Penicillium argentinense]|uniref:Uncharacterized protein n=1 Tax=Penicillium argentinense TaxID=1131581 RepID=A0A9W9KLM8_9EURO|nr:uncharacterized protein N7532_002911 [Penicillium argentinense]KAJ5110266.1 hypothetical protein N7532_002911 [Penicillium argentinense]
MSSQTGHVPVHETSHTYRPVALEEDEQIKSGKGSGQGRPLWTPFFLRRSTMVAFLLAFIAILCSLAGLFVYTTRRDSSLGIQTAGKMYYYLWTYGPTAVLTVLASCWTQVEYRVIQLMPWVLMFRGPTAASESIFLDYLSSWNVESLFKSIKRKHYLVSLGVGGSLLLNAAIVFSTGLFELRPVSISQQASLTATHMFDGTSWNPLSNDGRAFAGCVGLLKANLTPPIGIHDNYIYQPFQNAKLDPVNNYTVQKHHGYEAKVNIFKPTLECSNATVRIDPLHGKVNPNDPQNSTAVYTSEDGCSVDIVGVPKALILSKRIGINVFIAGCQGQSVGFFDENNAHMNWSVDWRLWAEIAPTMGNGTNEYAEPDGWEKKEIRVTMCKPGYDFHRGPVKIERGAGEGNIISSINLNDITMESPITDVSGGKLVYAASRSLAIADGFTGLTHATGYQNIYASNLDPEQLWDSSDLFTEAIHNSFSCLMGQVAKNSLLVEGPQNIQGIERTTEARLFVRELSFYAMTALIALLSSIVIFLLSHYVPVTVCSRDTSSIGGLATIFARSPDFMADLHWIHLQSETQMAKSILGQNRYTSGISEDGSFRISSYKEGAFCDENIATFVEKTEITWWRPLSATWVVRLPLVVMSIAVIVGLESVFHISESSHGIALVEDKSPYLHYLWVYLPAVIMFAVRCLFQSVEFGARIIQPYSRLRKGSAPPETTIWENQLRKIAAYGVYDAFRKGQWALATATIALLLGAITPIFVSGLYTTADSEPTFTCRLAQETKWNLETPSNGYQSYWFSRNLTTDLIPGMILGMNLSYPQWTYKDLAFPQFAISDPEKSAVNGYVQARLPALRGRLECQERKDSNCTYDSIFHSWKCDPDFNTNGTGYVRSVSCPGKREYYFDGSGAVSRHGHPTHRMLFSKCSAGSGYNTSESLHVVDCNAKIEEVDVDVRLETPNLSFDADFEPRVVEGSTRLIPNTSILSFVAFGDMRRFLINAQPSSGSDTVSDSGDAVTWTAINGINGVPGEELLSPTTLISRVNEIFGIITAQALNSGGREPFDLSQNQSSIIWPTMSTAPTYKAVLHDKRKYLVQNKVSTRILEALLGSMLLCALISLFFIKTKKVIPKNPCSIGAVASLLYGSGMLSPGAIPKGSEYCTDDELRQRGVFEEKKFTMGWWRAKEQLPGDSGPHPTTEEAQGNSDLVRTSSYAANHSEESAYLNVEGARGRSKIFAIDIDSGEQRKLLQ